MSNVVAGLFWSSLVLVGYTYIGYPLIIFLCSTLFARRQHRPAIAFSSPPLVTVLVAALNEEQVIAQRIENALKQDYPEDRLEIVIASDGSRDGTNDIVRSFCNRFPARVRLLDFADRRGKATVLNQAIPSLAGDIVVLSDANTFFESSAVRHLVPWFSDSRVSSVCGTLLLVDPRSGYNVDSLYWRYENFLKQCEGRLGALLGSNGAIYAFRRQQYLCIPNDTIIDDFVIPLMIKRATRGRIVYDKDAVACEETPALLSDEFRRRCRIGAGGFQSVMRLWPLALPIYGWTSLAFTSHKLLRWMCPLFLATMLTANAILITHPLYQMLLALQVAFYSIAILGLWLPGNHPIIRIMRLSTMFTSMNVALAVGCWQWISGAQKGTWQRTAR